MENRIDQYISEKLKKGSSYVTAKEISRALFGGRRCKEIGAYLEQKEKNSEGFKVRAPRTKDKYRYYFFDENSLI